jgi:hypothetical protein
MCDIIREIIPIETKDASKPFDMAYASAVNTIKKAIQRCQARTLRAVSNEVLSLNYAIGRYISENSRKGFWGKGALVQISGQLQKEMPGLKGYGETSLNNMRTFYEEWCAVVNRQPLVDDLQPITSEKVDDDIDEKYLLREIRQPLADKYIDQVGDIEK